MENKGTDQIVITITKDRILTTVLVILIVTTIIIGYLVVSNKQQVLTTKDKAGVANSMHGGGGNKKFTPLTPGTVAPDFTLDSTAGRTISLSEYKGKNVFLFFNEGVMCSPCWQEISRLERFKDDFEKLNAVIIPISVDDQKIWDPIIKEEKITTPILIDKDRQVAKAYKALKTPSSMHDDRPGHTYVHVDPQGRVHSSADFPSMNVATNILLSHLQQLQNSVPTP